MRQIIFTIIINGLFVVNTFAQWSQAINGMGNQAIGALLADGDTLYATSTFDAFKSTNQGDNWFTINNGLPAVVNFNTITKSGQFLVTGGEGIWLSSNNGASWFRTTSGVDSNEYVFSLFADGNTVYAGFSDPSAVGISTNNGNTWTKSTNGIASSQFITGVTKLGSSLFATHMALGVYESTDNGASWTLHSGAISAQDKNAIVTSGSNLCVATTNGVWTSTDNGVTWVHTLTTGFLTGFNRHGNYLYVIGSLPPYRSSDNGITWAAVDDNGLITSVNNTIQFTSDYALINTFGIGVYRRSLSQITSVIGNDQGNTVENFKLEQNYP
ncbi:MAG: hypothetical protein HXY50_03365, partial [Ignavibacteriaceae bacterium]|nr:hypothetical protein [Ignavibacteriaceae bacterium]